ncbi:polymorphic toxin-type HINT domain-containing protein [Aquabacterium humicola]|uniref:polymorphic toxin-type HINT domain-containing protein n=1 Tax=Aquabacterium humicola TaxID=3237377 RepID=UPI002542B2FF|nr:polymorphic toxin-type HINT domain-containing protein [Rubrivivax pictus]
MRSIHAPSDSFMSALYACFKPSDIFCVTFFTLITGVTTMGALRRGGFPSAGTSIDKASAIVMAIRAGSDTGLADETRSAPRRITSPTGQAHAPASNAVEKARRPLIDGKRARQITMPAEQPGQRVKPIEQIQVGDMVWSWDDVAGKTVKRRVVQLFRRQDRPVLKVVCGVDSGAVQAIEATTEHPFWVKGKGWTPAHQLRAGELLRRITGEGELRVIEVIDTGRKTDVFNFEVDGLHNYFVGREGVLVHNESELATAKVIRVGERMLDPDSGLDQIIAARAREALGSPIKHDLDNLAPTDVRVGKFKSGGVIGDEFLVFNLDDRSPLGPLAEVTEARRLAAHDVPWIEPTSVHVSADGLRAGYKMEMGHGGVVKLKDLVVALIQEKAIPKTGIGEEDIALQATMEVAAAVMKGPEELAGLIREHRDVLSTKFPQIDAGVIPFAYALENLVLNHGIAVVDAQGIAVKPSNAVDPSTGTTATVSFKGLDAALTVGRNDKVIMDLVPDPGGLGPSTHQPAEYDLLPANHASWGMHNLLFAYSLREIAMAHMEGQPPKRSVSLSGEPLARVGVSAKDSRYVPADGLERVPPALLERMRADAVAVLPYYPESHPRAELPITNNCTANVIAVDAARAGHGYGEAVALSNRDGLGAPPFVAKHGGDHPSQFRVYESVFAESNGGASWLHGLSGPAEVSAIAQTWGDGARGIVHAGNELGGGHFYNVEVVNGIVVPIDGTRGTVGVWTLGDTGLSILRTGGGRELGRIDQSAVPGAYVRRAGSLISGPSLGVTVGASPISETSVLRTVVDAPATVAHEPPSSARVRILADALDVTPALLKRALVRRDDIDAWYDAEPSRIRQAFEPSLEHARKLNQDTWEAKQQASPLLRRMSPNEIAPVEPEIEGAPVALRTNQLVSFGIGAGQDPIVQKGGVTIHVPSALSRNLSRNIEVAVGQMELAAKLGAGQLVNLRHAEAASRAFEKAAHQLPPDVLKSAQYLHSILGDDSGMIAHMGTLATAAGIRMGQLGNRWTAAKRLFDAGYITPTVFDGVLLDRAKAKGLSVVSLDARDYGSAEFLGIIQSGRVPVDPGLITSTPGVDHGIRSHLLQAERTAPSKELLYWYGRNAEATNSDPTYVSPRNGFQIALSLWEVSWDANVARTFHNPHYLNDQVKLLPFSNPLDSIQWSTGVR